MSEPRRVTEVSEIDPLLEASKDRPVFLFKHSLACGISQAAFEEYRRFAGGGGAIFSLVEIQRAREVSRRVVEVTGVRHQSPQAILLVDGRPVWHASHWSINETSLSRALADHGGTGGPGDG